MKTKANFLVVIFLTFCISSIGQAPTLAKVTPPSPNAQALQKYGDIPVSPYTGIPNIAIPLYTIKFKDITVPISISYHASGIKVAEEASQVGLGWALNAGGVISRNIIGGDDLLGETYFNGTTNKIKDFAAGQGPTGLVQEGCILSMFNRSVPESPTLYSLDLTSYLATTTPPYDFQPDQYFFNFINHAGKCIKNDGYVGMGTTTPSLSGKLTVAANLVFANDSTDYVISGSANGEAIRIKSSGATADQYLQLGQVNNKIFYPYLTAANNSFIGIGTTNPSQILSVKRTILALKVKVSTVSNAGDWWPNHFF